MTVSEKVAYIKGLAEGLGIDGESKQGKLFGAIIDVLEDIAYELEDINDSVEEVGEGLDEGTAITVDFDDSIIEDKGSDFERDCRMLELGVLEREEFRAKWILNNA